MNQIPSIKHFKITVKPGLNKSLTFRGAHVLAFLQRPINVPQTLLISAFIRAEKPNIPLIIPHKFIPLLLIFNYMLKRVIICALLTRQQIRRKLIMPRLALLTLPLFLHKLIPHPARRTAQNPITLPLLHLILILFPAALDVKINVKSLLQRLVVPLREIHLNDPTAALKLTPKTHLIPRCSA